MTGRGKPRQKGRPPSDVHGGPALASINSVVIVNAFLARAHKLHRMPNRTDTQCAICWGWYDDPRHL